MRPTLISLFVLLAACGPQDASTSTGGSGALDRALGATHLRLMAGNLTASNQQSYTDEGLRLFQAARPDVALLQEFNRGANTPAELRGFVDAAFGPEFQFVRGSAAAQIPNGVVSRYPIVASGDWVDPYVTNRAFTWARLDVPGEHDLWAVSLHLLTRSATVRQQEAQVLVALLAAQVPAGDYLVVGGDFNTAVREEPVLGTLASVVVTTGPYPVDSKGVGGTNASRLKPYDWVLVSPTLQPYAVSTELGGASYAAGAVIDTRVSAPSPTLPTDSAAVNMQHMGVVRDFDLSAVPQPAPQPPVPPAPTPALLLDAPNGGEVFAPRQSITVRWTASNVSGLEVQYAADGVTFVPVATAVDSSLGAIGWTVPAQPTEHGLVRLVSGAATDVSDAPFRVVAPAKVLIDEVLANEPGSVTAKEFVELVNVGGVAADLSGWALSDATQVRHRFAAGVVLAPGARLVVFGGASGVDATLPQAQAASTGTLSLNNGADTVTLLDASGVAQDSVSYPAALAAVDGVSMTRQQSGVPGSPFVLHTTVSGAAASPGAPPR